MQSLKYRLRKQRDINKVFLSKRAVFGKYVIINFALNELSYPRFAFVISKKTAKKAVDRNYFKRVLRHIVQKNIEDIQKGFDFVVVIKKEIQKTNFAVIEQDVLDLIKKIR